MADGLPLPDLTGRTVLVTGANSGLGLETARALAGAGARVVVGARSEGKAAGAIVDIHRDHPDARLESLVLDLADLSAIARAAEELSSTHDRLDVLVNNAGVMMTPPEQTADGFELQLGVNHLGHVALTARLLGLLLPADAPRVVTVSSMAHKGARIDLDDLMFERREYDPDAAYGQSKLANLMFTLELQRRADAAGARLRSVGAHPGLAATQLTANGPARQSGLRGAIFRTLEPLVGVVAGSAADGARPQITAAAAPGIRGGEYLGPAGPLGEIRGKGVARAEVAPAARDQAVATALWERSCELVGLDFDALHA